MKKERRFVVMSDEQGYEPGPGISCSVIDTWQNVPVIPAQGLECHDMRSVDAWDFCRALNQLQEDYDRYNKLTQGERTWAD
jgi:hypothetical protein